MSARQPGSKQPISNSVISLQDHHYFSRIMDVRRAAAPRKGEVGGVVGSRKLEYCRSFSQVAPHGKSMVFRYFTLESMFLLVCLTMSLLILPLVLPPLPPPPFMLLLLPILLLVLLMFLAFMPVSSNVTPAYA